MKFIKTHIILIVIIILGLFLRVFPYGAPPALNIDEAALGYNAYAILKTGADEHGRFLPLTLESFGDWKLPVYSYLATLPIAIFGLTELATRFPSIIAGTTGIWLIYLISQQLFRKKTISLFAAFFFALSPWSIYFSRAAYETNVATAFFLGGLLLFLLAQENLKNQKLLLAGSSILFGVTLFTYHSYIIFMPVFFVFLAVLKFKNIIKRIIFFLLPFIIIASASFVANYINSTAKFTTTTVFNDENILFNRVNDFRNDIPENTPAIDMMFTKYLGIPYQILQNYINSFSPAFLFDRGGEKLVHNVSGFGNLYAFDILLLFVGILSIFYKKEKSIPILLGWLILSPIPSALTVDAPNSTRLFMLMPLFVLISGYGAYMLFSYFTKIRFGKFVLILLSFAFALNVLYFFNLYIIHLPYQRAAFWRVGYKEVVLASNNYPDKNVVMQGVYEFPYIYFLFYNAYDPLKFREEVEYYPRTADGFKHVKSFGRYTFVPVLAGIEENPDTLYIDTQNFHHDDNIIFLPNGDPIFKYYIGK